MSATVAGAEHTRLRIRVRGTVQGVGFRPYVHRLAAELGLGGYVLNDAQGVLLEVEGPSPALDAFLARLQPEAPPLAEIEQVVCEPRRPRGQAGFAIRQSPRGERPDAPVTPDSATCPDCLAELLDPADRRYRYPFINCTNCGPRFTIVRGVPYDRPLTTMAGFAMCVACRAEYEDPGDRRFHAQPNACSQCGPRARLVDGSGAAVDPGLAEDPVRAAARALGGGAIVAVKGVGGYHLACRADDEEVVARLRARKHRDEKPFALMARDLAAARELVELDAEAAALMASTARPIVLAARRPAGAGVAVAVAPGLRELGVMLPYTPLHHLLLGDCGTPLVMTSGNVSSEPICFTDEDALARLGPIADLFLVHDRPIQTRTDDSVLRAGTPGAATGPSLLRRSRGYVPGALPLPLPGVGTPPDILACGAELKSTFCLARGRRAWVSHHIGDLENVETLTSFVEGIEDFRRLFAVVPRTVAHDLHTAYLSTAYAQELDDVELLGVQHHHAHLAACLAEHGECGTAVGAIFDGTGYGLDGTVWGGELLVGDIGASTRVGSLRAVRMPGGEQAIRQPWRMACAWLQEALGGEPALPVTLRDAVSPRRWSAVARLARPAAGPLSPVTSSMGRLFDAVAALAGVRARITYEGQAAVELEAACDPCERGAYPLALVGDPGGSLLLDPRETILAVAADAARGEAAGTIAARFHAGLARATVDACVAAGEAHGTGTAALAGGVFANLRLLDAVAAGLAARGMRVLTPRRLPCGDGGISYGQAAVAAWLTAP